MNKTFFKSPTYYTIILFFLGLSLVKKMKGLTSLTNTSTTNLHGYDLGYYYGSIAAVWVLCILVCFLIVKLITHWSMKFLAGA